MAATITLRGDNQTDDAFDEAIAGLDRLESEARDASVATSDLAKEMDARKASAYSRSVKNAADELDGTAAAARRAKNEVEELARQGERMESFQSNVTALSTGFLAVVEGLDIAYAGAEKLYESISRLAEAGDVEMVQLKDSLEGVGAAFDRVLGSGTLLALGGDAERAAERFGVLATTLDTISHRIKDGISVEDVRHWGRLVQEATTLGTQISDEDALKHGFDFVTAAARTAIAERRAERQKAVDALEQANEQVAAAARARAIQEQNDLGKINEMLRERRKLLEDMGSGRASLDPEAMASAAAEIVALEQRRVDLVKERAAAEAEATAEAERQREAIIAAADADAERAASLQERMEEGIRQLVDEERERQQTLEEYALKRDGREEEIHGKRMQWIEEETQAAVKAAETEEERIAARLEGERRLRNEVHSETMRLLEEEERAKEEAARAAKVRQGQVMEHLQGEAGTVGEEGFNRQEAIKQVLAGRLQGAREEFLGSDEAKGLSKRELERELEQIRRQVHRQTVGDVKGNRLTGRDLEQSQQQLAETAGRQAESTAESQAEQAAATREALVTQEEVIRNQQAMARELASLRGAARAQAERARDIRRGLGNG